MTIGRREKPATLALSSELTVKVVCLCEHYNSVLFLLNCGISAYTCYNSVLFLLNWGIGAYACYKFSQSFLRRNCGSSVYELQFSPFFPCTEPSMRHRGRTCCRHCLQLKAATRALQAVSIRYGGLVHQPGESSTHRRLANNSPRLVRESRQRTGDGSR